MYTNYRKNFENLTILFTMVNDLLVNPYSNMILRSVLSTLLRDPEECCLKIQNIELCRKIEVHYTIQRIIQVHSQPKCL